MKNNHFFVKLFEIHKSLDMLLIIHVSWYMEPSHLMNSILWRNHKILFGSYHDTLKRWMNSIMNILECTNINQNQIVEFYGASIYFRKSQSI